MAIYGQSLWGKDVYGASTALTYSVTPVSAVQTGYGEITLNWVSPANSPAWQTLRLVRNAAGYPATETDGDILLELKPGTTQNSYTDSGLTGGKYYYYSWYIASSFPAYSSTAVYQAGDTVTSGGTTWICKVNNTTGVTPATGATWSSTNLTALWNRAGQAASLAVADYGFRDLLYTMVPTAYATAQDEVSALADETNTALASYLSVLAWGLDTARTELGEQEHLHRVETMPLSRMQHLITQLGLSQQASLTPRLLRYRVANATQTAKRKGTPEAIKEAIHDLTGYDSVITPSVNLMLDADQTEFAHPTYPAWDGSVNYPAGAVVSYNGYLYTASSNTVKLEAETQTLTLNGAPSSVVQNSFPTVAYSNGQQVLIQSKAVGQAATLTITIPTTGTYDLSIGMTRGYDYGITEFAVDGTTIYTGRVTLTFPPQQIKLTYDGYAASAGPAVAVYLGRFSLSSGTHTIKLTVNGKNAKSGTDSRSQNGGYQIGVDYLTYTPTGATTSVGVAPTGQATNNAFWTYSNKVATTVLNNPLTGGVSSWQQTSYTGGATPANSSIAVYSGTQALDATGDNTAGYAVLTNATGVTATLSAYSIPSAKAVTWDATTTYPRNSYVTYNGTKYLALLPSQGTQPDADLAHWQPLNIATSGTDRYLVSAYGIPLVHHDTWSAGVSYDAGDVVQYRGQLYTASVANLGSPPTGQPTDNTTWAWMSTAQDAYCASAWTKYYSGTAGGGNRHIYISWFDASGNNITTLYPRTVSGQPCLYVPFARNTSDLTTDPGMKLATNGLAWTSSSAIDKAAVASGMAYWSTRSDTAVTGRHVTLGYDRANINIGLTFMTAAPTNVEHGIVFRRSDANNFWTASRTRLTKTVAGALTVVASWTALSDGARIYVSASGSTITVFKYQGAGLAPIQLATTTDSFNSTALNVGLFERAM